MTDSKDLETRVRVLEDIEAIRQLKARYWRTFDHKLWDDYAECLTEDFTLLTNGKVRYSSRKDFIDSIKGLWGRDTIRSASHGHHCEIRILSESTATGIWAFSDHIADSQANTVTKGRAYYEEDYVKRDGRWRIRRYNLTYILREQQSTLYGQPITSPS